MVLLFCWGVAGFALNSLLYQWLGDSVAIGFISVPVTLIISLALTGLVAAVIGKIIPNDDSKRERRVDLVGKAGEAIYDIDATFGMANVRGEAGDLYQVPCRTEEGKPRIPKGAKIVLFEYDRDKGIFQVAPFDA
jgi:membrane protein implicated in regulation of membrane protease activity